MDKYTQLIDFDFFNQHNFHIEQAPKAPWQFFITYPDFKKGERYVWYPTTGTLVHEFGDDAVSAGKKSDPEAVINYIISKI